MYQLKEVSKSFSVDNKKMSVLHEITTTFKAGDFALILGASGSGKTTLLNIISGLDTNYEGEILYEGQSLKTRNMDEFHKNEIGFVFQNFNLLTHLSVLENVKSAYYLNKSLSPSERDERAIQLLTKVGLADHINKSPNQLSGGQKQRVAIARALANNPKVIIADEPTGALDSVTAAEIINLLKQLSREGTLVITVTHDESLISYATKVLRIKDGYVIDDERISDPKINTERKLEVTSKVSLSLGATLHLVAYSPNQITSYYQDPERGGPPRPSEILKNEEIMKLKELYENEGVTEVYEKSHFTGIRFKYHGQLIETLAPTQMDEANLNKERYNTNTVADGYLLAGVFVTSEESGIVLPASVAKEILGLKSSEVNEENVNQLISKPITLVYQGREQGINHKTIEIETVIRGITSSEEEGFVQGFMASPKTFAEMVKSIGGDKPIYTVDAFTENPEAAEALIKKYKDDPDYEQVQGTIESYTINGNLKEEENAQQAIIYTQKRDFKNDVINELKENLVEENIYVQVEPIEEIGDNKIEDWDKVVILSTIQSSNPPEKVFDYINQHKNDHKLSIYLTADSSKWSKDPGDLDVTTAASKSENINVFSEKIKQPTDDAQKNFPVNRVQAEYQINGELQGTARVEYLLYYLESNMEDGHLATARIVGFLHFEGQYKGKTGTFTAAEKGIFDKGALDSPGMIINSSGELEGLEGSYQYDFIDGTSKLILDLKSAE
ncbi:hypothetical protein HW555_014113 [Spodoptera exigua]|uniref:ABC transporter domain-containing protein n=1 Tax=Spodoptera exigua TaxID=7107 RepID=A0A835G442_SPOEX|nr:hypothetical protein HW555_014113 [Spodoptera exigua]